MKLEDGNLVLTEEELVYVKRANCQAGPATAGLFLRAYSKNNHLFEDVEHLPDLQFFIECIQAYRQKKYTIV